MTKGYHDSKTKQSDKDLWRTPKWLFDFYNNDYSFDTDVAASEENKLCNNFIGEERNSLSSDVAWGDVNWCNPPYSDIKPWVEKAIQQAGEGKTTVMLIPADTSVKWFERAWKNSTECHFITGRIAFINESTGNPVSGNNKGSVIFIFQPNGVKKVVLQDRDTMKRLSIESKDKFKERG